MEQQAIARMNGGLQNMMQGGGGGNVMGTPTSAQRPGISGLTGLNSMSPAPNQQISRPRKIFFLVCTSFLFVFTSVALQSLQLFFASFLFTSSHNTVLARKF